MPSELELLGRIALALVLGAAVGLEREINDHPAGLRTHISVAAGAALFVIAGAYGFREFEGVSNLYQSDPTRIASAVVSGMGFLGGGAILKYGATVRGLTTAASMWVTAAIGLAVGVGEYIVGVAVTAALLFGLVALRGPKNWVGRRIARVKNRVLIRLRQGANAGDVIGALSSIEGIEIRSLTVASDDDGGYLEVDVDAQPGTDIRQALSALADRSDVERLSLS